MTHLNTIELFCGTKSFSKVMSMHGHDTLTIDIEPQFEPTFCMDILALSDTEYKLRHRDIMWASPPCHGFSVAAIGRNWNRDYTPKTDSARLAMTLVQKTISIIEASNPKIWFIENPRGMLRKMPFMSEFMYRVGGIRRTITYCQYGDSRQKPTDIWTNATWWLPRPACNRGASCHVSAPRGSRTGTQGIKGAIDRGRIPEAVFEEILLQMPK